MSLLSMMLASSQGYAHVAGALRLTRLDIGLRMNGNPIRNRTSLFDIHEDCRIRQGISDLAHIDIYSSAIRLALDIPQPAQERTSHDPD